MPEQSHNQAPTPDQSLLLSPEDLATKQAKWQAEGYTEAEIIMMTELLKSLSEMQDFEKAFIAKGEAYWQEHPEELKEATEKRKEHEEDRREIKMMRDGMREALAKRMGKIPEKLEQEDLIKELDDLFAVMVSPSNRRTKFKAEQILPKDINYKAKAMRTEKTKFGEYTLNPEMAGVNFENSKIFIPDLSGFIDQPLYEVLQYVVDTYGEKYYIPGLEFWKWVPNNPNQAEKLEPSLKDGNSYYLPGSTFCDVDGYWSTVCFSWISNGMFNRRTRWLENFWNWQERVLLLEK